MKVVRPKQMTAASVKLDGDEAKIEKLLLKKDGQTQIRLSAWRQGKMLRRPLYLSEKELIDLLQAGLRAGILSQDFLSELRSAVEI